MRKGVTYTLKMMALALLHLQSATIQSDNAQTKGIPFTTTYRSGRADSLTHGCVAIRAVMRVMNETLAERCVNSLKHINPLRPYFSNHVLRTFLFKFPLILTVKIYLSELFKTVVISFTSWPSHLIQGRYCTEKLEISHPQAQAL